MKHITLCLVLLSSFSLAAETKFIFTGDANVKAYFKNSTGRDGTQAFNQFFRLNAQAKPDENLTLKVGAVLSSSTWEGDNHKGILTGTTATGGTAIGGTNDDGFGNSNVTRLDHAAIEYTKNNYIAAAGRLVVSTPGGFVTSDDRRDRVLVAKIFDNYDMLAFAYDKRAEGSLTNKYDDVDMWTLNYYGNFASWKYALQTAYWKSKTYATATSGFNGANLDNIKQVSPHLLGTLFGVETNFYYTLLSGGKALYKNDHHAFALKLAKDLEVLKVEVQSMVTRNGGLVSGGFDSLSSIINSSPDHYNSSIKLRTVGFGLGAKAANETLHMLRLSRNFGESFSATVGGGFGKIYNASVIENDQVVDATAKYKVSENLSLNLAWGRFFGDFKDHAGSLAVKAHF